METSEPVNEAVKITKKIITKRKSFHKPAKANEIYIRREMRFAVYLKRAIKLFNDGEKNIFIYGMGATIEKAVKLALKLQQIFCGVTFEIKTSTVKLIDDVVQEEGVEDSNDKEVVANIRTNSSISIKVRRE